MQTSSQATVLVVDDDPGVGEFVSRCLRAHGYRVLEATSGVSALWAASEYENRIDLLLSDVMMPGMDGRELARRFRREHSEARVLFISGYGHLDLPPDACFLKKPFTARALLEAAEQTLAGSCACRAGWV